MKINAHKTCEALVIGKFGLRSCSRWRTLVAVRPSRSIRRMRLCPQHLCAFEARERIRS